MANFVELENELNKFKIDANEELMQLLIELHNQLFKSATSICTKKELTALIKGDQNILDKGIIDDETAFYEELRNFQDVIINTFGIEE